MNGLIDTNDYTLYDDGARRNTMETFHIPEGHLPWLAEAVAKLAKAAEKLGTPAPSYEVVERYERRWHDEMYGEQRQAMVKVEVDHVTPIKDGYQFVATVAHHQNEDGTYTNIVRTAPSFRERLFDWNIADFTTASPECGHCQQRRNRNTTYFFHHPDTNEKIQVGATCMKDFTGHNLSLAFLASLDEFRQEIEGQRYGRSDGPSLMEVLTYAAIVISAFGYKSSKAANEYGGISTSQHVQTLRLGGAQAQQIRDAATITHEQAVARATEIRDWVLDLTAEEIAAGGLYLNNLHTAINHGLTDHKNLALVISAFAAKKRADGIAQRQAERAAEVTAPVIEGRVEVVGTIISYDIKENDFGVRTVITVKDHRGFKVWGTCPRSIDYGDLVNKQVRFTAEIEKSDRDETFGFFKRPTKAQIIEAE